MRAWILCMALTGCCAETFEIRTDRSDQPLAQIALAGVGTTETGTLSMLDEMAGFTATLVTEGPSSYRLHVPSRVSGTFTGALEVTRVGLSEQITVVVDATDLEITQVCMRADQNDYGTGRCGFSFVGTLTLDGTNASLGEVTATWIMNQRAYVADGTPDC